MMVIPSTSFQHTYHISCFFGLFTPPHDTPPRSTYILFIHFVHVQVILVLFLFLVYSCCRVSRRVFIIWLIVWTFSSISLL
jgi:hypothetical protein